MCKIEMKICLRFVQFFLLLKLFRYVPTAYTTAAYTTAMILNIQASEIWMQEILI